MLLILTGDIQIGKTRWLLSAVDKLEAAGIACDGVVAPGIWELQDDGTYDKKGIDNILLPGHALVPFAKRVDLASAADTARAASQSESLQLAWRIYDSAIDQVNEHFDRLIQSPDGEQHNRLLVIDELGRLELLCNKGLTSAMELLAQGPNERYTHALVVARDLFELVEKTEERFAEAWGGSVRISPNDEAWNTWLQPMIDAAHAKNDATSDLA